MEKKVILLYGNELPPYKHIEKVVAKYWRYYERDRNKGDYEEDRYYDVWVSFQFTDVIPKDFTYVTLSVPISKEFLPKFLSIFEKLKTYVLLCEIHHSHPNTEISGITYEGYCYICSDGKQLFFLETYCNEENYEDSIHTLGWYQRIPEEKRWHMAMREENTDKVFERWVKNLISSYAQ